MSNIQFAKEIALNLLQIDAIKLNVHKPFTWASGIQSPIYCDNRKALSHVDLRNKIVTGLTFLTKVHFAQSACVAGVATAGIPHGALLADRLNLPFAYVRSSAKEHGLTKLIEGDIKEDAPVLVVEDLISTGMSSLKAVQTLRDEGLKVAGLVAIFDYGFESTKKVFEDSNCPYVTLTNYNSLLEAAAENEMFTDEELNKLHKWRENPHEWR